jgi:hypothetical protein
MAGKQPGQDDIHYFMLNPAGLNSSQMDSLVAIVPESIPPGWELILWLLKRPMNIGSGSSLKKNWPGSNPDRTTFIIGNLAGLNSSHTDSLARIVQPFSTTELKGLVEWLILDSWAP